jgi:cell division transport system ATP-binding protein
VDSLRITGIEDLRNNYPDQLSGGEKQRAGIARALVHSPKIMIADEPTGNLDDDNARRVTQLLLKINKGGTTVILATHNDDVMKMAEGRVIELNKGRLTKDTGSTIIK